MSNGLQYLSVSRKTKTVLKLGCCAKLFHLDLSVMQFNDLRIVHNADSSCLNDLCKKRNSRCLSNPVNKCWGVDDDAGDDAGAVVQFQHQLRLS
ncbi:MAG TPA: hypothetical protein VJ508_15405, partial [Saprospiraceae bacterium]|nr:hypothetical protein [Saprospiraceae bacterium]